MRKIVVLISGTGSNLKAICEHGLAKSIALVISNNPHALGVLYAQNLKIPCQVIDHKQFESREDFDQAIIRAIDAYQPSYIILAGFMRILTPSFIQQFKNKILNIHPAVLPAFIGAHAKKDAFDSSVKITGVTVHFVTEQLDAGPILIQGVVGIKYDDTLPSLSARISELEHKIYPFIIQKCLNGEVSLDTKRNYVVVQKNDSDKEILGKFYDRIFY